MKNWLEKNKELLLSKRVVLGTVSSLVFLLFIVVTATLLPPPKTEEPNQQIEAFSQVENIDTRPIIMLDAGHGGDDPGALDTTLTISEAAINQRVADKVEKLLANHGQDLKVVQSHITGETISTTERAVKATEENADLFISLHLNSDWNANIRGFQCFAVPPGRVHHQESVRFAEKLVENMSNTEAEIMGTCGIYYTFYKQTSSGEYEKEIYDSGWFDHTQPRKDETFGVLEYSGCPAVLVEQWYISNPTDMALFNSEAGMDTMAQQLYKTICEYFGLSAISQNKT